MSIPVPLWTARVWQEFHAGNLTRAYRDVLLTLRTFRGHGGHCWPSHATLADRAECCVRTVQRALTQAQHLELVDWVERRVRAGWRWLRSSNSYRFVTPAAPVQAGMRPVSTTGQKVRGGESPKKQEALNEMLRSAAGQPDLLAARRQAMQQRLIEAHRVR